MFIAIIITTTIPNQLIFVTYSKDEKNKAADYRKQPFRL